MPSAAAREMENRVARIIFDAGGSITAKEVDGAGHNCWSYMVNGHERCFHFAKTPASHGNGVKNTYARLRREVKETAKLPPKPVEQLVEPKKVKKRTVGLVVPLVAPTPPASNKLTASKRKEIAKRYLSLGSLEELCREYDLDYAQAEIMILGQKGQAAEKLRKEKNLKAADAAKALRENRKPARKRFTTLHGKAARLRNRQLFLYNFYGVSFQDLADLYNLTTERVRQIVRAEEKKDVG